MSITEERKRERAELAAINEVIKTIASSLDLRQVYETFARQLKRLIAFDRATVGLIEGDKFRVFALSVDVDSQFVPGTEMPLKGTAAEWVAASKKVHITADLAKDRQYWTDDVLFQEGMRSVIRIPLFSGGEVIGGFSVASREPNAFGEKEQRILEEVAPLLAVAIEKASAEEGLRAERDKLHRMFSSFADGVDVVSRDYRVHFQNKLLTDSFGDLTGRLCYEGYMARSEPCEFCPMVKAIANNRTESVELVGADGRNYDVIATPFVDIDGETKAIEVVRDITERKRVEEALQRSEEKYRQLFEATLDGMVVIDAETMSVVLANQAAAKIYGFDSVEGITAVNSLDFIPAEDRDRVIKIVVEDLFENNLQQVNEFRSLTRDGREIWVSAVGMRTEYQGKLAGLIAFRDITERKLAEEMLRDSEEMSRGMLESAATGIYIVQAGKFQYVSPLFEEISGYTSDELIGTYSLDYVHPEDREATRKKAIENLKGQSSSPHEFRFIRKDGKPVWVLEKVASIQHKGERAAVGSFMDITERKLAEEELRRHARREEALHAIAKTVSQTLDLEEMLDSVVEKVKEAMEADVATISLIDEVAGEAIIKAHRGLSEEFVASVGRMKLDHKELERVMGWEESFIANDAVLNEANLTRLVAASQKEGLGLALAARIFARRVYLGSVSAAWRYSREFNEEDLELLTAIANQIAVGIQNAKLFADMSHGAITDGLTGLYNHRYFQERLEEEMARVLRFGGECSLIMLDLDHFKIYNDLFGHVAGDEVLKQVGRILCEHTREVDIACRYGGEEFALILPQTGPADAYQAAERLRQAVERAFSGEGTPTSANLTISLGIASCPGDGLSREALIHSADLAMREAKQRGRNQTCSASDVPRAVSGEPAAGWEIAEHLEAASLNTIYALAAAVDARDHYTYGHSRNVAKYAVAIGKALGLSRRRLERLRICALLHDIGKIGLSDSIIKKPGPLDEAEWEMMKKHSVLVATIVSHTPELADCASAIRCHHEWQDGGGYPDGLSGEDIPLGARIIAIADAYDTMTTPRAYRQTLSSQEALEELRRCVNTQFDPQLVETFAHVVNSSVVSIT